MFLCNIKVTLVGSSHEFTTRSTVERFSVFVGWLGPWSSSGAWGGSVWNGLLSVSQALYRFFLRSQTPSGDRDYYTSSCFLFGLWPKTEVRVCDRNSAWGGCMCVCVRVCAHIHTCAPMIWYQYKRNLAISLSLPTFLPFSHHPVILPLHPPEVWVLPTLEKAHLSVPREFIVSILHMYCQGGFWKPFLGLSSEPIGSNHCS